MRLRFLREGISRADQLEAGLLPAISRIENVRPGGGLVIERVQHRADANGFTSHADPGHRAAANNGDGTSHSRWALRLEGAITTRTARVVVVGQGYVGLPLAMAAAGAGFRTTGLDPAWGDQLNLGLSHVPDVPAEVVSRWRRDCRYEATTDPSILGTADVVIICVPTPLKHGVPDLSHVTEAGQAIGAYCRPGVLVILESTTYPGTTEELLLPLIASDERVLGESLFLAFSPERIDPGNPDFRLENIPKLVGGAEPLSGDLAASFYAMFVTEVVQVPGTREAEMAKLIENTFRHVNIALMNEMAVFCRHAGIDVHAAIRAAATKPFGYMPFQPGPGVGGHCIPVDPNYLAWRFRLNGTRFRLAEVAEEVNSHMPQYVVQRIQELLNLEGLALRGARILVVGVAYKPEVNDCRESPAIPVIQGLVQGGADVAYVDPFVSELPTRLGVFRAAELDTALARSVDCAVILTPHRDIDYQAIIERSRIVYDTRAFLSPQLPHINTL